jgi:redox-sensitive bicupin YhaK (pirin superfamily)
LLLDNEQQSIHRLQQEHTLYAHVVAGTLIINNEQLDTGDGVAINDVRQVEFHTPTRTEALIFDLP